MSAVLRLIACFCLLTALIAGVAALSDWPRYRSLPEGVGVLTLSFSHGADRGTTCRPATPEELAALPPNMRQPLICPRERPPVRVELEIDGAPAFTADVPPSGIGRDGPSRVHENFVLPAGTYAIAVRMRDRPGEEEFDWQAARSVHIDPADHRVIDFRAASGGFLFH